MPHTPAIEELHRDARMLAEAGDHASAAARYGAALAQAGAAPAELRYELLSGRAASAHASGDYAHEELDLADMAEIAVLLGDLPRRAQVLARQVQAAVPQGRAAAMRAPAEALLAAVRAAGDRDTEAECLAALAEVAYRTGDFPVARAVAHDARATFERSGARAAAARMRWVLSAAARETGRLDEARAHAEAALALYRALGDRRGEAEALNVLGLASPDYARRRAAYEQALALFQAVGDRERQATACNNLGNVYLALGVYGQARTVLEQAVRVDRAIGAGYGLAYDLDSLAWVTLAQGDAAGALPIWQEASALAQAGGVRPIEAFCALGMGQALLALGNGAGALALLREAGARFRELGMRSGVAAALGWQGAAHLARGDVPAACDATAEGVALLEGGGDSTLLTPQYVWWWRYRALAAASAGGAPPPPLPPASPPPALRLSPTRGDGGTAAGAGGAGAMTPTASPAPPVGAGGGGEGGAASALAHACAAMLAQIAELSDPGLRRCYLARVAINRAIAEACAAADGPHATLAIPERDAGFHEQLARMLAISRQLNEQRDPAGLRAFILDELVELTGAELLLLVTHGADDASAPRCEELDARGAAEGDAASLRAAAAPLIDEAVRARQPLLRDAGDHSVMVAPLVAGGHAIGAIYAAIRRLFGPFTPRDLDMLGLMAGQAAVALDNARLFEEALRANRDLELRVQERTVELRAVNATLGQRAAELAVINEVVQALAEQLDFEMIVDLLGDRLRTIFRSDGIVVGMLDAAAGLVAFPYVYEYGRRLGSQATLRLGEGLTSVVITTRRPLVIGSAAEAAARGIVSYGNTRTESWMGVPLPVGDQVIGALSVHSGRQQAYSESDVHVLATIAASVGVALQNARLYEETQRRAREMTALAEENARLFAEAEAARAQAEAASLAKSTFLANMSHELRTPLNAVLGFAQVMERDRTLAPRSREHLAIIARSGEHLLGLINDVLELSKIEAGRTTLAEAPFDLHDMLRGLEEMFRLRAQARQLGLAFAVAPDVPRYVSGDQGKLRQILINLLGNAVKFTQRGGVTLKVERQTLNSEPGDRAEQQAEAATFSVQRSAFILFQVEDTGEGIAAEDMPRLFHAFVQTASGARAQEGTGLGLAIARQFARLMGGDITATSAPGRGSTFRAVVRLAPADHAPAQAAVEPRRVVGLAPGGEWRMLVVDDIPDNRQLLAEWLRTVGFAVREAADGAEAVAIWQEWAPHMVWMDMRMPVMDGYEATRRIKGAPGGEQTVVVAFTASVFEHEQELVRRAGCDDALRKPAREAEVFGLIARHLDVRFVYEDAPLDASAAPPPADTRPSLAALPPALRGALRDAVRVADIERIAALDGDLRAHDPALAALVARLAAEFRIDQLLELAQEPPHE